MSFITVELMYNIATILIVAFSFALVLILKMSYDLI